MDEYLRKMELNIKLDYIKAFFLSLLFFLPIWYAFETQYASPAALGIIYAISHLLIVFLELPTGASADLIGRKKTIFIGLLIIGIGWIYISQAKSAMWLWIGYFINAVGTALTSGADTALTFDSLKELKRDKGFARVSSKSGVIFRTGMIASTLSGAYLYGINKRLPYLLVGACVFIAALLTLKNTEPKIDTEKFTLRSYTKQTKQGARELFKNEYIRDFSIYYIFVGGITWYFLYFLNQSFATEIGFSDIERGWLFSVILMVAAIINYFLVRSKYLSRNRVYVMFPVMMVLGFLPGFWASKTLAIFCIFLIQFSGSARFSILDQYANEEFESKYRATAVSALNMGVSLFFSILSIIGGRIIGVYGPGLMMSLLGGLTIIIIAPVARVLVSKHKEKAGLSYS